MNVHFEILMTEITLNKEMTFYNHLFWDLKPNRSGITYFKEIYDDVDEHSAFYEFFRNGELICTGEGEGIDQTKIGVGGISVFVQIHYPEHLLK